MPKMKTHSGAKKRFRKTATTSCARGIPSRATTSGKKSAKRKRRLGRPVDVAKSDQSA